MRLKWTTNKRAMENHARTIRAPATQYLPFQISLRRKSPKAWKYLRKWGEGDHLFRFFVNSILRSVFLVLEAKTHLFHGWGLLKALLLMVTELLLVVGRKPRWEGSPWVHCWSWICRLWELRLCPKEMVTKCGLGNACWMAWTFLFVFMWLVGFYSLEILSAIQFPKNTSQNLFAGCCFCNKLHPFKPVQAVMAASKMSLNESIRNPIHLACLQIYFHHLKGGFGISQLSFLQT